MKLSFAVLSLIASLVLPTTAKGLVGTAREHERKLLIEFSEGIKDSTTPKVSMSFNVNPITLDYYMDIQLSSGEFAPPTNLTGCADTGFEPELELSEANQGCQYNNGNCVPNMGHLHTYVGRRSDGGGRSGPFETIGFGVTVANGVKTGNLCDFVNVIQQIDEFPISRGDKLVVILEYEHNDHSRRTKFAPRDFPPIDVVTFIKRGRFTKMCIK